MIEEKKQEEQNVSLNKSQTMPRTNAGKSDSYLDRPDSGFDSKDEESLGQQAGSKILPKSGPTVADLNKQAEEDSSNGSSPDTPGIKISRQAPIRQPVLRKRRLNLH